MPPKRKASQRRSSSPTTLESIVKSNPAAWEKLQAARKESNESFRPSKARSASSSTKQESEQASVASGSKPSKRRKIASDDDEYVEEGNAGNEGEPESSSKSNKKREAGRPGRPPVTSKPVKALVVLTHGTTDYTKTLKGFPRPPWDLIVAGSMSGLSFIAGTEDEIVIERTWSDDEGYQYVASAFPSLIKAIKAKLSPAARTGRCLLPLYYYNKALQVGQGFDGESIFKRLDPKDGWSSRYLFFITPVRLSESDLSKVSLSNPPSLRTSLPPPTATTTSSSSSSSKSHSTPSISAGLPEHTPSEPIPESTTDDEVEFVTVQFQSQASFAAAEEEEEEEEEESPPSPPKPTDTKGKGKARQVPPRPVPRFIDPLAAFALDVPNPHVP